MPQVDPTAPTPLERPAVVVTPASSGDPLKPATQTTEFKVATVVGIFGAVIAGASVTFAQLKDVLPGQSWVVVCIGLLSGLGTLLGVASKFISARTDLKVAQVEGAAAVQAARESNAGK